jgi:hypothetical protein
VNPIPTTSMAGDWVREVMALGDVFVGDVRRREVGKVWMHVLQRMHD